MLSVIFGGLLWVGKAIVGAVAVTAITMVSAGTTAVAVGTTLVGTGTKLIGAGSALLRLLFLLGL